MKTITLATVKRAIKADRRKAYFAKGLDESFGITNRTCISYKDSYFMIEFTETLERYSVKAIEDGTIEWLNIGESTATLKEAKEVIKNFKD